MKTVLITGASRGLGLGFVTRYLERGERVFAVVRRVARDAPWQDLAAHHPGRLSVLTLDLADSASFAAFAADLASLTPALDVLVNNAGVLASGERLGALTGEPLLEGFRINAMAPLLLTQALTPMLAAGDQPRVAMLSSELGSIGLRQRFGTPSYSIIKAALNMATRLLALELGPRGIGCVALRPGWVRTDMGGTQAPLSVDQAVGPLIERIDLLTPEQYGGFYSADGSALPW